MHRERNVNRYTAYFRGWCQAFGEHEAEWEEGSEVGWLFADGQVGLVLGEELRRAAYRELLVEKQTPVLILGERHAAAGSMRYELAQGAQDRGFKALRELLTGAAAVHLYLTYHFTYPPGTRIVTFSRRTPLPLLYKAMAPLQVKLL